MATTAAAEIPETLLSTETAILMERIVSEFTMEEFKNSNGVGDLDHLQKPIEHMEEPDYNHVEGQREGESFFQSPSLAAEETRSVDEYVVEEVKLQKDGQSEAVEKIESETELLKDHNEGVFEEETPTVSQEDSLQPKETEGKPMDAEEGQKNFTVIQDEEHVESRAVEMEAEVASFEPLEQVTEDTETIEEPKTLINDKTEAIRDIAIAEDPTIEEGHRLIQEADEEKETVGVKETQCEDESEADKSTKVNQTGDGYEEIADSKIEEPNVALDVKVGVNGGELGGALEYKQKEELEEVNDQQGQVEETIHDDQSLLKVIEEQEPLSKETTEREACTLQKSEKEIEVAEDVSIVDVTQEDGVSLTDTKVDLKVAEEEVENPEIVVPEIISSSVSMEGEVKLDSEEVKGSALEKASIVNEDAEEQNQEETEDKLDLSAVTEEETAIVSQEDSLQPKETEDSLQPKETEDKSLDAHAISEDGGEEQGHPSLQEAEQLTVAVEDAKPERSNDDEENETVEAKETTSKEDLEAEESIEVVVAEHASMKKENEVNQFGDGDKQPIAVMDAKGDIQKEEISSEETNTAYIEVNSCVETAEPSVPTDDAAEVSTSPLPLELIKSSSSVVVVAKSEVADAVEEKEILKIGDSADEAVLHASEAREVPESGVKGKECLEEASFIQVEVKDNTQAEIEEAKSGTQEIETETTEVVSSETEIPEIHIKSEDAEGKDKIEEPEKQPESIGAVEGSICDEISNEMVNDEQGNAETCGEVKEQVIEEVGHGQEIHEESASIQSEETESLELSSAAGIKEVCLEEEEPQKPIDSQVEEKKPEDEVEALESPVQECNTYENEPIPNEITPQEGQSSSELNELIQDGNSTEQNVDEYEKVGESQVEGGDAKDIHETLAQHEERDCCIVSREDNEAAVNGTVEIEETITVQEKEASVEVNGKIHTQEKESEIIEAVPTEIEVNIKSEEAEEDVDKIEEPEKQPESTDAENRSICDIISNEGVNGEKGNAETLIEERDAELPLVDSTEANDAEEEAEVDNLESKETPQLGGVESNTMEIERSKMQMQDTSSNPQIEDASEATKDVTMEEDASYDKIGSEDTEGENLGAEGKNLGEEPATEETALSESPQEVKAVSKETNSASNLPSVELGDQTDIVEPTLATEQINDSATIVENISEEAVTVESEEAKKQELSSAAAKEEVCSDKEEPQQLEANEGAQGIQCEVGELKDIGDEEIELIQNVITTQEGQEKDASVLFKEDVREETSIAIQEIVEDSENECQVEPPEVNDEQASVDHETSEEVEEQVVEKQSISKENELGDTEEIHQTLDEHVMERSCEIEVQVIKEEITTDEEICVADVKEETPIEEIHIVQGEVDERGNVKPEREENEITKAEEEPEEHVSSGYKTSGSELGDQIYRTEPALVTEKIEDYATIVENITEEAVTVESEETEKHELSFAADTEEVCLEKEKPQQFEANEGIPDVQCEVRELKASEDEEIELIQNAITTQEVNDEHASAETSEEVEEQVVEHVTERSCEIEKDGERDIDEGDTKLEVGEEKPVYEAIKGSDSEAISGQFAEAVDSNEQEATSESQSSLVKLHETVEQAEVSNELVKDLEIENSNIEAISVADVKEEICIEEVHIVQGEVEETEKHELSSATGTWEVCLEKEEPQQFEVNEVTEDIQCEVREFNTSKDGENELIQNVITTTEGQDVCEQVSDVEKQSITEVTEVVQDGIPAEQKVDDEAAKDDEDTKRNDATVLVKEDVEEETSTTIQEAVEESEKECLVEPFEVNGYSETEAVATGTQEKDLSSEIEVPEIHIKSEDVDDENKIEEPEKQNTADSICDHISNEGVNDEQASAETTEAVEEQVFEEVVVKEHISEENEINQKLDGTEKVDEHESLKLEDGSVTEEIDHSSAEHVTERTCEIEKQVIKEEISTEDVNEETPIEEGSIVQEVDESGNVKVERDEEAEKDEITKGDAETEETIILQEKDATEHDTVEEEIAESKGSIKNLNTESAEEQQEIVAETDKSVISTEEIQDEHIKSDRTLEGDDSKPIYETSVQQLTSDKEADFEEQGERASGSQEAKNEAESSITKLEETVVTEDEEISCSVEVADEAVKERISEIPSREVQPDNESKDTEVSSNVTFETIKEEIQETEKKESILEAGDFEHWNLNIREEVIDEAEKQHEIVNEKIEPFQEDETNEEKCGFSEAEVIIEEQQQIICSKREMKSEVMAEIEPTENITGSEDSEIKNSNFEEISAADVSKSENVAVVKEEETPMKEEIRSVLVEENDETKEAGTISESSESQSAKEAGDQSSPEMVTSIEREIESSGNSTETGIASGVTFETRELISEVKPEDVKEEPSSDYDIKNSSLEEVTTVDVKQSENVIEGSEQEISYVEEEGTVSGENIEKKDTSECIREGDDEIDEAAIKIESSTAELHKEEDMSSILQEKDAEEHVKEETTEEAHTDKSVTPLEEETESPGIASSVILETIALTSEVNYEFVDSEAKNLNPEEATILDVAEADEKEITFEEEKGAVSDVCKEAEDKSVCITEGGDEYETREAEISPTVKIGSTEITCEAEPEAEKEEAYSEPESSGLKKLNLEVDDVKLSSVEAEGPVSGEYKEAEEDKNECIRERDDEVKETASVTLEAREIISEVEPGAENKPSSESANSEINSSLNLEEVTAVNAKQSEDVIDANEEEVHEPADMIKEEIQETEVAGEKPCEKVTEASEATEGVRVTDEEEKYKNEATKQFTEEDVCAAKEDYETITEERESSTAFTSTVQSEYIESSKEVAEEAHTSYDKSVGFEVVDEVEAKLSTENGSELTESTSKQDGLQDCASEDEFIEVEKIVEEEEHIIFSPREMKSEAMAEIEPKETILGSEDSEIKNSNFEEISAADVSKSENVAVVKEEETPIEEEHIVDREANLICETSSQHLAVSEEIRCVSVEGNDESKEAATTSESSESHTAKEAGDQSSVEMVTSIEREIESSDKSTETGIDSGVTFETWELISEVKPEDGKEEPSSDSDIKNSSLEEVITVDVKQSENVIEGSEQKISSVEEKGTVSSENIEKEDTSECIREGDDEIYEAATKIESSTAELHKEDDMSSNLQDKDVGEHVKEETAEETCTDKSVTPLEEENESPGIASSVTLETVALTSEVNHESVDSETKNLKPEEATILDVTEANEKEITFEKEKGTVSDVCKEVEDKSVCITEEVDEYETKEAEISSSIPIESTEITSETKPGAEKEEPDSDPENSELKKSNLEEVTAVDDVRLSSVEAEGPVSGEYKEAEEDKNEFIRDGDDEIKETTGVTLEARELISEAEPKAENKPSSESADSEINSSLNLEENYDVITKERESNTAFTSAMPSEDTESSKGVAEQVNSSYEKSLVGVEVVDEAEAKLSTENGSELSETTSKEDGMQACASKDAVISDGGPQIMFEDPKITPQVKSEVQSREIFIGSEYVEVETKPAPENIDVHPKKIEDIHETTDEAETLTTGFVAVERNIDTSYGMIGAEEKENKSPAIDLSLSDLLHKARDQNPKAATPLTEKRDMAVSTLELHNEETDVHEAKTDEEADEAEVMVESSKDIDVKTPKKHSNILSGVSSKVKHSISKVKKAITGKSSSSKTKVSKTNDALPAS